MKISVFFADCRLVFMKGLAEKLRKEKYVSVDMAGENGLSTLDYVIRNCPDIFIYDIDANGERNGFPLLREIRNACGDRVRSIALSDYTEPETYGAFFHFGGWAYELKSCSDTEITVAMQRVCHGKHFLCSSLGGDFAWSCFRDNPPLHPEFLKAYTPTEIKVLALVKKGCSAKEVAVELDMKVRTAEKHIERIMKKMDVHTFSLLQKRLLYTKVE
jgi:DNA-binding NarL/FixJ family response regulator